MLVLLTAVITLSACGKKEDPALLEERTIENIQEQLLLFENYGTKAIVKRHSNKGENSYETMQFYKKTGEYRIEILSPEKVAGTVTIFDGKMVSQFNPRISGKVAIDVPDSRARDEMFLGVFIKNYLQSEDVTLEVSSTGKAMCTVLEAKIPGEHPYLASEKLWVNNETFIPEKLVIYDKEGKEKIEVIFEGFQYNMNLDDEIFKIKINE